MKTRSIALLLVGSMATGLLLGMGGAAASAGTLSSNHSFFTSGVFQYEAYATIRTAPSEVRGSASIKRVGASTPANYVGANGRYFRASNNAMIAETGFRYNSSVIPDYLSMTVTTPVKVVSSGVDYYAWGVVKGSNSSSYATYYTFKTVTQRS